MPRPFPALCFLCPCVTAFCNFASCESAFYRSKSSVSLLSSPLQQQLGQRCTSFPTPSSPRVLDSAFPSHLISDYFLRLALRSPANLRLLLCSSSEQQLPVSSARLLRSQHCIVLLLSIVSPEPRASSILHIILQPRAENSEHFFEKTLIFKSCLALFPFYSFSPSALSSSFVRHHVRSENQHQRAERSINLSFRHSPLHAASRTSAALSAANILFNIFRPSATRPNPCSRNDQASHGPCPLKQTARPIGRQIIKVRPPPRQAKQLSDPIRRDDR